MEHGINSMESRTLPNSKMGMERVEDSAHNSNIEQQNGGVKKEQVKG